MEHPPTAPRRVHPFAAIVSILAVAGAVLLGIYGQPIDSHRSQMPLSTPEEVASWIAAEHDAMETIPGRIEDQLAGLALASVHARLGGRSERIESLVTAMQAEGFEFLGAGPTGLPAPWAGAHALFVSGLPASGARGGEIGSLDLTMISVAMVPDVGQFGREAARRGEVMELRDVAARGSGRRRNVWVYADDQVVYFLIGGRFGELPRVMEQWASFEPRGDDVR